MNLTSGPALDVLPAFSPDGNEIVFSRMTFDTRGEQSELFVMRTGGTSKKQLTDTPRSFEQDADRQPLPPEMATFDQRNVLIHGRPGPKKAPVSLSRSSTRRLETD